MEELILALALCGSQFGGTIHFLTAEDNSRSASCGPETKAT